MSTFTLLGILLATVVAYTTGSNVERQANTLDVDIPDLMGSIQSMKTSIMESQISGIEIPLNRRNIRSNFNVSQWLMPCPDPAWAGLSLGFQCGRIPVDMIAFENLDLPILHREQIYVWFAYLPAIVPSATHKAIFRFEGGPGAVAHESYVWAYTVGRAILPEYDIVLMDQRGVGWSCSIGCPQTGIKYAWYGFGIGTESTFATNVTNYRDECIDEIRQTASLYASQGSCFTPESLSNSLDPAMQRILLMNYVGTKNVAMDVDAVRQAMGYDKIWLHGSSYGTVTAQTIGAMYPDSTEGISLDSPVNSSISTAMWVDMAPQFAISYIMRTLEICYTNPLIMSQCAPDFVDPVTGLQMTLDQAKTAVTNALTGSAGWPKTLTMQYLDLVKNQLYPYTFTATREMFQFATLEWTSEIWRTGLARALADIVSHNNWVELFKIGIAPFSATVHLPSLNITAVGRSSLMSSVVGNCPIIAGRDNIGRLTRGGGILLSPADRAKQLARTINKSQYTNGFVGARYVWVPAGITAFEHILDPMYSPEIQNATYLPNPGMHTYPIYVVGGSTELEVDYHWRSGLTDRYITTGPAGQVEVMDGRHANFAASIPNTCVNTAVATAIRKGTAVPQTAYTACPVAVPMTTYWKHEYATPVDETDAQGIGRTLRAVSMDMAYRNGLTPAFACGTAGYAYIQYATQRGQPNNVSFTYCGAYNYSNIGVPASVINAKGITDVTSTNFYLTGFNFYFYGDIYYSKIFNPYNPASVRVYRNFGSVPASYTASTGSFNFGSYMCVANC